MARGRDAPLRLRLLPAPVPLRGDASPVRADELRRADAAGAAWTSSPSCAGSTRRPRASSRSSGVSTSPGAPRSSHGTSRTGRSRRPSSGMSSQSARPSTSGWPRLAAVGRGDDPAVRPPLGEDALDRTAARGSGPSASTTTAASTSSSERARARSEETHPARAPIRRTRTTRTPCDTVSLGGSSSCAPSTTTISSTEVSRSRSRTRGRRRRCFGLPNRDASPAARTIAATRIVSSRRR